MKPFLKTIKASLLISASVLVPQMLSAQVTATKFYLNYNTTNCNYEAHMVVTGGSASGNPIAGAVQFTIVVPHGTTLAKVADVQPKTTASGLTTPSNWKFANTSVFAPTVNTSVDYIATTLSQSPTPAYPALSVNTDLVLFTFTASTTTCGAGIRMWVNNNEDGNPDPVGTQDPISSSSGLGGADFNNSFTVNGATETYVGHATSGSTVLPKPTVAPFTLSISGGNIVASSAITSGSCATLSSYNWTGPNSYSVTTGASGTSATANLSRVALGNLGTYTLKVTNSNGCSTSVANIIALPIKLLYFKGDAEKCAAQLSWAIVHGEKDFQGFDLQYSTDADHYGTIAHLERNAYNDVYSSSYIQASGKGFYRLKITDLSGKVSYSETVPVTTDCDNAEITIAPNPTQALSTVSGIEAGDQVKVSDMLGNVVANYVSGGAKATIDLGIFPSGVYSVMISRGDNILKTAKLTKL